MLSTGALINSFCFMCLHDFVVTQITSHVSTPLGMQGSSKPFWEITYPLAFPAQILSLTPENKCSLGLFLGEAYGMRQEGVLRKKTLHELLTCDLDLSSLPFPKSGWYFNFGIGWLGAGDATQFIPKGFQTAVEHSKFSSTALVLQVTISQGKTLAQSTLIPLDLVESLH